MSTNEPTTDETETDSQTERITIGADAEQPIEYDRYDGGQTRHSSRAIVTDWLNGEYPCSSRSDEANGTIYRGRHKALQHDDGTGVVRWRRQRMGIRTVSGLIIRNSEYGGININKRNALSKYRVDDCDVDCEFASLPLNFIEGVASRQAGSTRTRENDYHSTNIVDVRSDSEGTLVTYKCGTQLFYGYDRTAHGRGRFGFVIEDEAPVPSPERALDLLRPDAIRRAEADGADLERQGEWFFIDESYADGGPESDLHKPGVNERPFGPSPLDNHVPRDWAAGVSDDEAVENYLEHDDMVFTEDDADTLRYPSERARGMTIEDAGDVVQHYVEGRMHYESSLTWAQLQDDVLGGVWLRGTVRHDDNEHYVENLGETWHKAVTHRRDVVTQDDVGRVRMD